MICGSARCDKDVGSQPGRYGSGVLVKFGKNQMEQRECDSKGDHGANRNKPDKSEIFGFLLIIPLIVIRNKDATTILHTISRFIITTNTQWDVERCMFSGNNQTSSGR
uniref:Uncharacterized protein n=1 Tax=Spongospora subterranea TaxID=70186 RepID=A0A0H5R4X7_9EUKA|eukprot:CRZ09240.1 hypothetical protein [Spongospora subterranea]